MNNNGTQPKTQTTMERERRERALEQLRFDAFARYRNYAKAWSRAGKPPKGPLTSTELNELRSQAATATFKKQDSDTRAFLRDEAKNLQNILPKVGYPEALNLVAVIGRYLVEHPGYFQSLLTGGIDEEETLKKAF